MKYTGERVIPWTVACTPQPLGAHVARYAWALPYASSGYAVDLGCGTGYGSFMLSWAASWVTGVDRDIEAIMWAQKHFLAQNLSFRTADIAVFEPRQEPDLYVCFEVLEHVQNPEKILQERRPLLWSLPLRCHTKWHVHDFEDLRAVEGLTGRVDFVQSESGQIAPVGVQHFRPMYALGVLR
jgi:SAM-dependent methyltransferase